MSNEELNRKIEFIAAQRLLMGKALLELFEDNHWKDSHSSFDDFIKEEFNISRTDADELMALARTLR